MNGQNQSVSPLFALPVNDPRRLAIRRAVFGTLLAAAIFFIFTVPTKQYKLLYVHAPWENDPFDTVYSFAMFIVPLVAACFLVQVSLCRRSEPLSIDRVRAILRGCRVAAAAMAIALVTDWVAVALGANRSQWTTGATGLLVFLLILTTVITSKVIIDLARAPKLSSPGSPGNRPTSDWLADAIIVAERESHRLGPLRRPALDVLSWIDDEVVKEVRRHPLLAAAISAGVFGVGVGGNQSIREGYSLAVTVLVIGLLFCGMFAFLVVAGSYLGIVRSATHLYGAQRRAIDASVVACVAAVGALAFRDSLWWAIGVNRAAAGPGHFVLLVSGAAALAFVGVLAVESVLGSHSRPG